MNDKWQQEEAWKQAEESALVRPEDFDDLGAGIPASFPIIGYRQSRWRLRWQGQEQVMVNEQGNKVDQIGVVLVKVPDHKSKRYWKDGYDEKSRKSPDCWSNDGARPEATINPTAGGYQPDGRTLPTSCSQCYWNEIGSMVSADGKKKMKACGDYKRVAVKLVYPEVPIEELRNAVMLLTVPAGSLKPLRLYGLDLKEHKKHASARVTFIGFDDEAAFQKFTFNWGPPLGDEDVQWVQQVRNGDDVKAILAEESAVLDPGAALTYAGELNGEEQQEPEPPKQPAPTSQLKPREPKQTTQAPIKEEPKQGIPTIKYPPPGGRPVPTQGGISGAMARPATPPQSARPVLVEPPQQEEAEERGDAAPADIHARFENLMNKP